MLRSSLRALIQIQYSDDVENLHGDTGTQALQNIVSMVTGLTLTYFIARSTFI